MTGPLLEKNIRKSIPNALAITRFGIYMMALKKPDIFSFSLESVNQMARRREMMICGMNPIIQISIVFPKYFQNVASFKSVA